MLSTIDDLAIWLDGRFEGYLSGQRFAWHDASHNSDHPPSDVLPLGPGEHRLLLRVRGGQYASGGFFAWVLRESAAPRAGR